MVYVPTESGQWVNEHYERLARVIKDYDPNLELGWIPPDKRTTDDKYPYAVIDTRRHHVIFYASELDTPEQILARLWRGDLNKNNPLKEFEAMEAAQKAMQMKQQLDDAEDAADRAKFLMQSPLHTVRYNGKKFDHNRRVIE